MKKVVITAAGNSLDSMIDERFGRAPYFIVYDLETDKWEAYANSAANAGGGAGTMAAQMVIRLGADTVVSGSVGPNAYGALAAAGIRMLQAREGTVKDVVEALKKGELQSINGPGGYRRGQ